MLDSTAVLDYSGVSYLAWLLLNLNSHFEAKQEVRELKDMLARRSQVEAGQRQEWYFQG
jgi:hypothetical protein